MTGRVVEGSSIGRGLGAGPAVPALTWAAAGGDAFVRWREVVCQAFTRLTPERLGGGPFAGEIGMRPIGGGASISRIAASGQSVLRRREDVAAAPCDAVFVNIQLAGHSEVRQCGIETRLYPGSFTVLDARRPFAMRFDGPFRQLCLHLPFAWFTAAGGFDPAGSTARRVDRGSPFGAALLDHAGTLLQGGEGQGAEEDGAAYLAHLLQLALAGAPPALADQHLDLVRRFVTAHCTDPDLSPREVAAQFRISVRHLHKLFARSGESFGRFLLRTRLERSLRAILARPDRGITAIALDAGFSDGSHFARCFRQRYGRSPRAARQEAATRG